MTKHEFKLKKNAISQAELARGLGYTAIIKKQEGQYKYCVYVYRKKD